MRVVGIVVLVLMVVGLGVFLGYVLIELVYQFQRYLEGAHNG